VASASVVEGLDEVEDGLPCLGSRQLGAGRQGQSLSAAARGVKATSGEGSFASPLRALIGQPRRLLVAHRSAVPRVFLVNPNGSVMELAWVILHKELLMPAVTNEKTASGRAVARSHSTRSG
jgi:hypothetical protein